MSFPFLSQAERNRLARCPDDVSQEDLDTYFQLSKDDFAFAARLRGDHNRLGVALQGCCLRYLGFFPDNLLHLAPPIVRYVAQQLGVAPTAIDRYGEREPTFYEHQQKVLEHLCYRRATPMDLLNLEQWLLERALEHDKPKLLFELACDYLYRGKIVRLGVTSLAKLVGTARSRAEQVTFERLKPLLTRENRARLDRGRLKIIGT